MSLINRDNMYLTSIDKKSGLVIIDDTDDGIMSIKAFRDVINHKDFGLVAFTCIALSVDYLSPIRHYSFQDRPKRAMRNVVGSSNAYNWNEDIIQNACVTYSDLQKNPAIEEDELLKNMRLNKLQEISELKDDADKLLKLKDLKNIKTMQDEFSKSFNIDIESGKAPTINGYTLSRLEQKSNNKKSFYHVNKKE